MINISKAELKTEINQYKNLKEYIESKDAEHLWRHNTADEEYRRLSA